MACVFSTKRMAGRIYGYLSLYSILCFISLLIPMFKAKFAFVLVLTLQIIS